MELKGQEVIVAVTGGDGGLEREMALVKEWGIDKKSGNYNS